MTDSSNIYSNLLATTLKELWKKRCKVSSNKTFIVEDNRSYSYKEVDELVNKKVEILRENRISCGMIVALQIGTSIDCISFILACVKNGNIVLPLYKHLDLNEAIYIISKTKPDLLITLKNSSNSLTSFDCGTEEYFKKVNEKFIYFIKKGNKKISNEKDSIDIDTPAVILCTSGTTSFSKAVLLTNRNILCSETEFIKIYNANEKDIVVIPTGFYHAMSFHHGLISTILAGSTMVLMSSYSSNKLERILYASKCTCIITVPTVIYDILNFKNLGKIKKIISGGDLLSINLLKKAKKRGIPIYNVYGLTEAVPFICTSPSYFRKKNSLTTAGYPISGVKVKLVDDQENEISNIRQDGEILVKGPIVFKKYYNDPEETKKAFTKQGWFRTGDRGCYLEDYAIKVDGRNSNKIIRGGENISANVVRISLETCPSIKEAFVYGIKDARLGEKIGAYVILESGVHDLKLSQVLKYLEHKKVDRKYWPEVLKIVPAFPRTSSGKIRITALNSN